LIAKDNFAMMQSMTLTLLWGAGSDKTVVAALLQSRELFGCGFSNICIQNKKGLGAPKTEI
jgi:hypothetical protein